MAANVSLWFSRTVSQSIFFCFSNYSTPDIPCSIRTKRPSQRQTEARPFSIFTVIEGLTGSWTLQLKARSQSLLGRHGHRLCGVQRSNGGTCTQGPQLAPKADLSVSVCLSTPSCPGFCSQSLQELADWVCIGLPWGQGSARLTVIFSPEWKHKRDSQWWCKHGFQGLRSFQL